MSFFMMKSILSVVLMAAAVTALAAMMSLMGKSEHKSSPDSLRRAHRVSGYASVILVLLISYFCITHVAAVGDAVPVRGVLHGVLALFLIVGIVIKIVIVRSYRQFLKYVPVMGMVLFGLIFVVVATSAGYFLVRTWCPSARPRPTEVAGQMAPGAPVSEGDVVSSDDREAHVAAGEEIYARHCAGCHFANKEDPKVGPGLKGLMQRDRFVSVDAPVTVVGVMQQIAKPTGMMPAFGDRLSDQDMTSLLAYLRTL